MAFQLGDLQSALKEPNTKNGVDFSKKGLKLDNADDAKEIVSSIKSCPHLEYLNMQGNTLGVDAAGAISDALSTRSEFKVAKWSDMFTGRMKTEIPPALTHLGNGMITAGVRLSMLDLSDNAFGPIGVEGLAKLLESQVCGQLEELHLNNNGLGITGCTLLCRALHKLLENEGRSRLRVFVAGRNRLENEGAKMLAKVFQKMGSLEVISMPQNGIYHVGIAALSTAFQSNPNLRRLNLNDNTIGPKGAEAFARALPKLKHLAEINFGDCLLKSKGAVVLAEAIKENSISLECLDVSENEIKSQACLQLVDCITGVTPNRLTSVVLRGNSFGANRAQIEEKLGDAGVLKDGDDSDENVSDEDDSDASSDSDDEQNESESSVDESAQESINRSAQESINESAQESINRSAQESINRSAQESINGSTINSAQITILDHSADAIVLNEIEQFLTEPTWKNLNQLGENAAELLDAHLMNKGDISKVIPQYVDALMMVSGLIHHDAGIRSIAQQMLRTLVRHTQSHSGVQWTLANAMLVALGLIKSENKNYKIKWDLDGCYSQLASCIMEPYFPENLRETIRFFMKNSLESKKPHSKNSVQFITKYFPVK